MTFGAFLGVTPTRGSTTFVAPDRQVGRIGQRGKMKHDKIQDDSKEPTGSFTRLVPTDSERRRHHRRCGHLCADRRGHGPRWTRVWMAFVLAATLSALTAMSYAELASMYPKAASEFEYSRQVAPRLVAFVVGWVMICGLIVAAAAVSLGFGRYFRQFLDVDERLPAAGLLFIVALTASAGIRRSAAITTLLSLIQVGGLLFVIAIGAPHIGEVDLFTSAGGTGSVIGAAALVFFAFIGFDEVTTLAEETRNPSRTVPRALLFGLGISTLLYVGVSIAAVSVLGANQLAVSERPLADVLDHVLGGSGQNVLAAVALLATTNTTLLCVTAASRMQFGMAEAGARPNRLTNPCPTARFRSCPYWGCLPFS